MKTKKSSAVMTSIILVYLAGAAVGMSVPLRASWMFWPALVFAISGAWVAGGIRLYLIRIERRDAHQADEAESGREPIARIHLDCWSWKYGHDSEQFCPHCGTKFIQTLEQWDEATSPALELLRQMRRDWPALDTYDMRYWREKIDAVLANTGKPTQPNHD